MTDYTQCESHHTDPPIKGDKGDKGDTGATGGVGARGPQGRTGEQGTKGDMPDVSGKIDKGTFVINVTDAPFNADPTGVMDSTAAIINAELAAVSRGWNTVLYMSGTFRTSGKITVRVPLQAENATIKYYGTGTALVIGDDTSSGKVTYRKRFRLPAVILGDNTVNYDGLTTGVILQNLNACDVYVPWVGDFENGLKCYGQDQGFAYNTITLGLLGQNHKNLILTNDQTGWCNQNTFIGGRLSMNGVRGAFKDDLNASHLSLLSGSTAVSGPNNNTFIGTSMEGENWAKYRVTFDGARFNTFLNCRWEVVTDPNSLIRYLNGSADNRIIGGYDSAKINEEFDTSSPGGGILDGQGGYLKATIPTTAGQSIPNGVFTPVNTWTAISSRRVSYDAVTGAFKPRAGKWFISATITYTPNATGRRRASIYTSNSNTIDFAEVPGNASRNSIKITGTFRFSGNETFVIQTDQNSGADLTLEPTTGYTSLRMEMLNT